ncbi:MAG: DUF4215 domain-containing protein [Nannocystis sp.]|nr:DUF4215 domain-containing protein [Nannocystis sp.]MBA3549847.1 DUF4215 domain-containing protein [Nannocystis sp.]
MGWRIGGAALWLFSGCASGDQDSNSGFTSQPQPTVNPTVAGSETSGGSTTNSPTTSSSTTTGEASTSVDPTTTVEASSSGSTASIDDTTSADASTSSTTTGPPPPGCGNAELDPLEECDDGNDVETDDCNSMCQLAKCGDGVIHAGVETCDDTLETVTCNADCSAAACGDSIPNAAAGETCDDGNKIDTDACLSTCKLAACGDNQVQAGVEECDDGNMVNGDGCENTCKKSLLPAECVNPVLLTDAFRNIANVGGSGCDNAIVQQWYRFSGAAGVKMPTQAPPTGKCGTDAPGWLSGGEPQVQDGAVARQVCFHWSNNTCNWSEPAMVRNCGDYYVYFLKSVSWGCNGRYCGTN